MQQRMSNRDYEREVQLERDREIGWQVYCDSCGDKLPSKDKVVVLDGDVLCWLCQSSWMLTFGDLAQYKSPGR